MFKGNKRPMDADSKSYKDATANMTSKEKREYFWEYYKLHVLGVFAVLFLVGTGIHSVLTRVETYLDFAFVHGFSYLHESSLAWDAGEDFFGEPPLGIWFSDDFRSSVAEALIHEDVRDNYIITAQNHNLASPDFLEPFIMFTSVGRLDIIITYPADARELADFGHFIDLTTLDWEIPAHVLYSNYAVHLQYFPSLYQHIYGQYPLVLAIATNSNNLEHINQLFNELLRSYYPGA